MIEVSFIRGLMVGLEYGYGQAGFTAVLSLGVLRIAYMPDISAEEYDEL